MPPSHDNSSARLTGRERLMLTALCLVVLLPGTFGVSLFDRDEGWYAQVSREMLAAGDWLMPQYLGEPWLAKPPLLYWCVTTFYAVFGVHVWAARLVSVLAMTGAVHLLASLATEIHNRRAAWIASASFITAGLPVVIGKMLLTDALLLLCCLSAMWALWRFAAGNPGLPLPQPTERRPLRPDGRHGGRPLRFALLFWLSVGLGILAKGPAVVLFVGAFALGLLLRAETRRRLLHPRLWLTSPLALIVAAPWYVYVAQRAGDTLAGQFLWYEFLSRLVSTPHGHGGPPGYFVALGLIGWLPWTALVPGAVIETWQARRRDAAARFLLLWLGLPWVVLELIPSKLPHYVLPCYVPLAIMLGRAWDLGLDRPLKRAQRVALRIWVALPMALGALIIAPAVRWHALSWSPAVGVTGMTLLAGFVLTAWLVRHNRLAAAWRGALGTTIAFHLLAGLWLLPAFEPYRLSRLVAERANALADPHEEVLVVGYTEPSVFFYLQPPARVGTTDELVAALDSGHPAIVIVRAAELAQADRAPPPEWHRVDALNYVKGRYETVWVGRIRARGAGSGPPLHTGETPIPSGHYGRRSAGRYIRFAAAGLRAGRGRSVSFLRPTGAPAATARLAADCHHVAARLDCRPLLPETWLWLERHY